MASLNSFDFTGRFDGDKQVCNLVVAPNNIARSGSHALYGGR